MQHHVYWSALEAKVVFAHCQWGVFVVEEKEIWWGGGYVVGVTFKVYVRQRCVWLGYVLCTTPKTGDDLYRARVWVSPPFNRISRGYDDSSQSCSSNVKALSLLLSS